MSKKRAVQGLMSLVRKDVKRKAEVEFLKNHNVSQSTLDNDFFRSNYQPLLDNYESKISNAYQAPPTPKEIPRNYSLTKAQAEDLAGEQQVDNFFNSWLNEENARASEALKGPNKKFNRPYDVNPNAKNLRYEKDIPGERPRLSQSGKYGRKPRSSSPYLEAVSSNTGIRNAYKTMDPKKEHKLIRAHALEQSAVRKLKNNGFDLPKNFSIYEMIPEKHLNYIMGESLEFDPRYAQSLSTQRRNKKHETIGGDLIVQLVKKYKALGYNFKPNKGEKRGGEWIKDKTLIPSSNEIKKINKEIDKLTKKLDDIKIPTMFYNPAKNQMKYYGKGPDNVSMDLRKDVMEKGYSKGGVIKNILGSATDMSRRSFLKGAGALAVSTALPMRTVTKMLPKVAEQAATRFAPPWVKSMISVLESMPPSSALKGHTLPNGTLIRSTGRATDDYRGKKQEFEVTNSDGYKVPLNLFKEKDGNIHVEFDVRDEFKNNQHIYMDKKTGQVEIVDENFYMTGPEDYAKDDPISWDVTTPSQMKDFEKKAGIMTGDGDDYLKDYMSTPEDGSYSDLFESFIDSFSPSGNIFHTKANALKEKVKKITEKNNTKKITEKNNIKKEISELDWESQFRGGNMHGYNHGGLANAKDKVGMFFNPPKYEELAAQANNWLALQGNDQWEGLSKDQSRHPKLLSFDNPESGIRASIISLASRAARTNNSPKISLNQIFFGESPWAEDQGSYRKYFKDLNIPTNTIYDMSNRESVSSLINIMSEMEMGNEDYHSIDPERRNHIVNQGIDQAYERLNSPDYNYYSTFKDKFNNGGLARRPEALPPLRGPDPMGDALNKARNNPGEYIGSNFIRSMAKGGLLKKIPKVLGNLSNYKAKIQGEVDQMYRAPKGPYGIMDENGSRVLPSEFGTIEEAKGALDELAGLRTQDASTFRIFGARPPKDAEGVSKAAPIVDIGMVGKKLPPEESGAMFWNSREKIINAPSEAMQGHQWLDFMKRGKHGILNPRGLPIIKDQELNDTSLAPYLSQMGKQIISKEKLVKEFDEMAPTFDVTVLGKETGSEMFRNVAKKLQRIDTQAYRNPQIKGFFDYMKDVIEPLQGGTKEEKVLIGNKINQMIERNFGIKNALEDGLPQRFPFEVKQIIQQLSAGLGKRASGFDKYTGQPVHEGTQTLGGGDNYREFLFTHKPGKLRSAEPGYKYAHDFNLTPSQREGGVVHTRVSDRTDQFGRRILHIEEIQSDMHQKINMAQRALKKQNAEFEKQGVTPEQAYEKMGTRQKEDYRDMVKQSKYAPRQDLKLEKEINANEQQMRLLQAKIEDLVTKPQNKSTQTRLVRLNKERAKIRKILEDEKTKLAESTNTSGIPEGPLRKTEDYNEFVIKYLLRVAEEGGYDGLSISTPAIKNLNIRPGGRDFIGNLTSYGPVANGAMKKAAKKSNAKLMKTSIVDDNKRGWEIPMILIKGDNVAKETIKKGTPLYKKGGSVKGKK